MENKEYASAVEFMSSSKTTEFYYTSDGRFSFIKEYNQLWSRKVKDNNMVIKFICVGKDSLTKSNHECIYCNDNGEHIQGGSYVNDWGLIVPVSSDEFEITYSISKSYDDEKCELYFFDSIDNSISFSSENELIRFASNNGAYTTSYLLHVSDEEKQELIDNFNNHNHGQLLELANKLSKDKDNYLQESNYCVLPFQVDGKDTTIYILKGEFGNEVSLYDGIYADGDPFVACDITDEQYDTLKDYMASKDEDIIAYIEQISSEQKIEDSAKNEEKTKVYTKQLPSECK